LVPDTVSVNPALPAATVDGEIELSVGVTTPLNPPHPVIAKKRPSKTDRETNRATFISLNGLSGKTSGLGLLKIQP
jgi:hypothetical protein